MPACRFWTGMPSETIHKIFLGISDITVLLNAIHHKTGLVTFHGDDVMWASAGTRRRMTRQELSPA